MKRKTFLPFIFLITFIVMFGSVASSANAHNHDEDSHQNEQSAVVHEHELEKSDPDKEAREVICCVAGSPKEQYWHNIHFTRSSTVCELYRERITACLYCGAVTTGAREYVNTHNPNTH